MTSCSGALAERSRFLVSLNINNIHTRSCVGFNNVFVYIFDRNVHLALRKKKSEIVLQVKTGYTLLLSKKKDFDLVPLEVKHCC